MLRNAGLRAGETIWRSSVDLPLSATSFRSGIAFIQSFNASRSTFPTSKNHLRAPLFFQQSRLLSSQPSSGRPPSLTHSPLRRWSFIQPSVKPSNLRYLAAASWRRHAHTKSKRRRFEVVRRHESSLSGASKKPPAATQSTSKAEPSPKASPEKVALKDDAATLPSAKSLLGRLPQVHRPTKEELLAAATGAWSRFKIHFKWFSIRSSRPWNIDDFSAFFTWIIAGHLIWIVVGTTTFFSLIIFLVNTVFAQETLARWIGNALTHSSGLQVIFESAVVPKWKDGVISFQNVFVSRRPGQGKAKVTKGSPSEAAATALAAKDRSDAKDKEDDGNYTQFDVSIDTVNVTLSFAKWFNGKGLLRDVEIKGVRGVIDRTHVVSSVWADIDPRSFKHEHHTGDFELESFKMEDLLVTVHQPDHFRPFSVSIYSCDLPQLRQQGLFYDFLSANVMSGSFDNSLFTIHPRQTHNHTGVQLSQGSESGAEATQWKKHARFRIDGLVIDHLNRGVDGMFSWIKEGKVDIVSDIMFPSDDDSIAKVMSDFYDRVEATVTSTARQAHPPAREGPNPATSALEYSPDTKKAKEMTASANAIKQQLETAGEDNRFMIMDMRVQLTDVRATVPFFTKDISYVNNALIRPIVAYINSRRAFIPVNCRVVKRMSDFDGSWTIYDSGLMDDVSREVSLLITRPLKSDSRTNSMARYMKLSRETYSMTINSGDAGSRKLASGPCN